MQIKLSVAQSLCYPGDVEGNLRRMEPLVSQAASADARLVLFAEGGVTGYEAAARSLDRAVVLGDDTCRQLHQMARQYQIVIAAGFMERNKDSIHISHGVFYPDGNLVVQRKTKPGPPEQKIAAFKPGPEERVLFEVEGIRCAITICADSGIENIYRKLSDAGVQLLLAPTAGCGPRHLGFSEASLDDPDTFERYLQAAESVVFVKEAIRKCRKYRIALAACNQMADDGIDYFHPGHSSIVDTTGEVAALIPGTFVFEHLRPRVAWGVIGGQ